VLSEIKEAQALGEIVTRKEAFDLAAELIEASQGKI
jgi:hypothetical protein